MSRLRGVMRKEILQLRRDRLSFGMIIGIPVLQLILFGYAINTDVRHLRAGVADQAQSQLSRNLIADAQASQVLRVTRETTTPQGLEALLRRGEITVGIYIPPDFERRVQQQDRPPAQLLVDGADPVILGAARQLADMRVHQDTVREKTAPDPVFEIFNPYNPERRSAVYIVPGLIGVILTMTMVLFTAVAIVRERERGNLELLITTPVRNIELMVGKLVPYIVIGLLQTTLILLLGRWIFKVPMSGGLLNIYTAALMLIAANLTMGLVISTLARSQFQAMQMTLFFFLPSILLSGFMFPFDGMPRPAQYLSEVLPLTHFLRMVRGIMLRGAELADLMDEIGALVLFAAITLTISIRRFKKRLD
jgi:ABC-2 type transport system permease protein